MPNGAEIDVSTNGPADYEIEISTNPNWIVTLDGDRIKPGVVGDVWLAVHIPNAGDHKIVLKYDAGSVVRGGIISLVGLVLGIGWILSAGMRKPESNIDINPKQ